MQIDDDVIRMIRSHAESVCRTNTGWDPVDLESDILYDVMRWPPKNIFELRKRMRCSTVDWQRRILRPSSMHTHPSNTSSLDFDDSDVPSGRHMEEMVEGFIMVDHLASQFDDERDRATVYMLAAGQSNTDVANDLGVSKGMASKRSAKVKRRMREVLTEWNMGRETA